LEQKRRWTTGFGFLLWARGGTECPRKVCPRKIKEVLRLRYDLGLLQHEIARSCSISQFAPDLKSSFYIAANGRLRLLTVIWCKDWCRRLATLASKLSFERKQPQSNAGRSN
jgi:hypothetical protein